MPNTKHHLRLVDSSPEYNPLYPRHKRDRCTIKGCSAEPDLIVRWMSKSSELNVSVYVCRPHLEDLFRDHADDVGPEGYDLLNIES